MLVIFITLCICQELLNKIENNNKIWLMHFTRDSVINPGNASSTGTIDLVKSVPVVYYYFAISHFKFCEL